MSNVVNIPYRHAWVTDSGVIWRDINEMSLNDMKFELAMIASALLSRGVDCKPTKSAT